MAGLHHQFSHHHMPSLLQCQQTWALCKSSKYSKPQNYQLSSPILVLMLVSILCSSGWPVLMLLQPHLLTVSVSVGYGYAHCTNNLLHWLLLLSFNLIILKIILYRRMWADPLWMLNTLDFSELQQVILYTSQGKLCSGSKWSNASLKLLMHQTQRTCPIFGHCHEQMC